MASASELMFLSKGAGICWMKAAFGCDDEAALGAKGTPYFEVRRCLSVLVYEKSSEIGGRDLMWVDRELCGCRVGIERLAWGGGVSLMFLLLPYRRYAVSRNCFQVRC